MDRGAIGPIFQFASTALVKHCSRFLGRGLTISGCQMTCYFLLSPKTQRRGERQMLSLRSFRHSAARFRVCRSVAVK